MCVDVLGSPAHVFLFKAGHPVADGSEWSSLATMLMHVFDPGRTGVTDRESEGGALKGDPGRRASFLFEMKLIPRVGKASRCTS
jgi:hypothetical protein